METLRHVRYGHLAIILGICCAFLLSSTMPTFAEEKKKEKKSVLEQFEEDFEEDDQNDEDDDEDDGWLSSLFGEFIGDMIELAFRIAWARRHIEIMEESGLSGAPIYMPSPWRFEAYPYSAGDAFSYRADFGKRYFIVPKVTYHHLSSGLNGIIADMDLRLWSKWGLHGQYKTYMEKLFKGHQTLDFASLSFKYAIIQTPQFYLETGLGPKGLGSKTWKGGPNVGCWARAFPMTPLVLNLGLEIASINDVPLTELSASVGLMRNNMEFRAGYRSLQSRRQPPLNGLEMGFGAWF